MKQNFQEIEVWYILPTVRREIVKGLLNKGLSQNEIAKKLGLRKSTISQYVNNKRGREVKLDEETICQVHVKAPPIHGRANAEVRTLVAKYLEISPTKVKIVSGKKAGNKTLLIEGIAPAAVRAALTR